MMEIDQRRRISPLKPCSRCGSKMKISGTRHRRDGAVVMFADCICGNSVSVIRTVGREASR